MRGPRSGARIAALAGLIVACCVAAIVFTVDQVSQERQATLLQRGRRGSGKGRSSIAALDGSVFDSPQDIYKQALRRFDRSIKADTSGDALAWAHPRWKSAVTGIVGGVQHASDLEAKIAKDVSRQLSGDISAVVAREVRAALKGEEKRKVQQRRAEQQSAKQSKLARAVQRKIKHDREALTGDERLATWLELKQGADAAGIRKGVKLALDFGRKKGGGAASAGGVRSRKASKLSFFDHSPELDKPVTLRIPLVHAGVEREAHAQGVPEHDVLTASGVNVGKVTMETEKEPEEDNRSRLEGKGVVVSNYEPAWAGRLSDDELKRAGVVTDRLPLLGQHYTEGIPSPIYERGPTSEAHPFQEQFGVNLAGPNIAQYSNEYSAGTAPSSKMDEKQRVFPYMDGLADRMQGMKEAEQHKPLPFWMTKPKKGSKHLEKSGVNVWGAPIHFSVPAGFFEKSAADAGSQALKSAGVVVDRSDFLLKAPVPH
ncbi:hypothetical protein T484DRAFT_1951455 [Baffinella frigidus]|nr:hypothetical protein T484DRAFT_1951455 [Cryptophyta sp. CCMP2293]